MNRMRGFGALTAVAIAVAATVGACTVKQNEDPTLTGPSTFVTAPSPAGPTANFTFTPTSPTANSPVAFDGSISCPEAGFTGGCVTSDRAITSFSWNFGDGTTGSSAVISHVFRAVGSFNVTLTVVSDRNRSSSLTKTVTVAAGSPPTADFVFSPTNPAVAQTVSFNASASKPGTGHQISTYAWDFGDGGRASGVNPTHGFGASGTYNVVLVVTDEVGQTATASKQVPVAVASSTPAPTADFVFSPAAPAVGQSTLFNASQSKAAAGHSIASYAWNFGDGGTGTDVTASHAFGAAGTYSVVLIVTDDVGQTATSSKTIPVSATSQTPPTASFVFSPASPATNQDVFFNASASTAAAGRSITTYTWDFGDGSSCSTTNNSCNGGGVTPTHAYTRSGTFTVTLTVIDNASPTQSGLTTRTVSVSSASGQIVAEFLFSPSDPFVGQTVFFDATPSISSSPPLVTISVYEWDFGDGTGCSTNGPACSGSDKKPQHAFGSANTWVVRLTVTDSANKKATTTHTVTVKVPPTIK